MNFVIKYIFYISSLTYKPTSEVVILQRDSITYLSNSSYITKPIIHKRNNMFVLDRTYVHITDKKIEIYEFGTKVRRRYKIRFISDQDNILVKHKPIWLN